MPDKQVDDRERYELIVSIDRAVNDLNEGYLTPQACINVIDTCLRSLELHLQDQSDLDASIATLGKALTLCRDNEVAGRIHARIHQILSKKSLTISRASWEVQRDPVCGPILVRIEMHVEQFIQHRNEEAKILSAACIAEACWALCTAASSYHKDRAYCANYLNGLVLKYDYQLEPSMQDLLLTTANELA